MEPTLTSPRFGCPHCGKKTKLPEPLPSQGLFKVSCAICQEPSLVRFGNGSFWIENSGKSSVQTERKTQSHSESQPHGIPNQTEFPTKPTPTKDLFDVKASSSNAPSGKKPLWERRVIQDPFPEPNFTSLKERIQNQRKPKSRNILSRGKLTYYRIRNWWHHQVGTSRQNLLTGGLPSHPHTKTPPNTQSKKPTQKKKSVIPVLYWGILAVLLTTITILTYLGVGILRTKAELDVVLAGLSKGKPTKILDRNGQVVSEIFQKRVSTLKLSDYPENLVIALLNVEDRGFYSHGGIDFMALVRATIQNTIHLRYKQGASTITQQLARIILDDRRKSLGRKWKELELALALESALKKDEILEYYMNHVYLGHGAFGFGEAVKFYFQKNPRELTNTEAILLATLPSAPNRNSPLKNPEFSRSRLEYILEAFRNRGVIKDIPHDEITHIYTDFLTRSPNETVFGNRQDSAPYVTEHVRSLLKSLGQGEDIYDEGGFIVETTIVKEVQEAVGSLVFNHLQKIQKSGQVRKTLLNPQRIQQSREVVAMKSLLRESGLVLELTSASEYSETGSYGTTELQGAVVAIDPATGEILFMHGGSRFQSYNQFNRAIQMRRQTGSSIKPILYASAINSGKITTGDKILDAPLIYRGVQGMPNWMPDNLGKTYEGEISPRRALTQSKNTAAVQIAEKLGYASLEQYFTDFFFPDSQEKNRRFRNDLSLALGSLELSPLEMASAFSSFLNEGKILRPYLVKRILSPNGKVIYERTDRDEFDLKVPQERSVIKPDTAEVMLSLLKDSGKASGVYRSGYKGIVAGKTGTTNDYKDAWFLGLRPGISLAIWIGYDDHRFGMGSGGLGGSLAAPLWGDIMRTADAGKHIKSEAFPKPVFAVAGRACHQGKSPCSDCPGPDMEWFTQDNPSPDSCTSPNAPLAPDGSREVLQELF